MTTTLHLSFFTLPFIDCLRKVITSSTNHLTYLYNSVTLCGCPLPLEHPKTAWILSFKWTQLVSLQCKQIVLLDPFTFFLFLATHPGWQLSFAILWWSHRCVVHLLLRWKWFILTVSAGAFQMQSLRWLEWLWQISCGWCTWRSCCLWLRLEKQNTDK